MACKTRLGAPDPRHVLCVQTCARPQGYLSRTLSSLKHAGIDNWLGPKLIVGDGYDPRADADLDGWEVIATPIRRGMTQTHLRMLVAAQDLGATRVTGFEDDVVFAKGALDYMARVQLPPEVFFASYFTLRDWPEKYDGPGWYQRSMATFARTQAWTIPRSTLDAFLDHDGVMTWPVTGVDNAYAKFWPDAVCAVHFPNLVQHIGDVSAHSSATGQVSVTFPGEDFDARAAWISDGRQPDFAPFVAGR